MSAGVVARAFLRRDLLEAASGRGIWVAAPLGIIITLLLLSGTARFIGDTAGAGGSLGEGGALGFLVLGIAFLGIHDALVRELPRRLRGAQAEGTLEAMLAGRGDAPRVALGLSLFPLARALLRGGAIIAAGALLFGLDLAWERSAVALAIAAAAAALFAAIGLCFSAATLLLGRAETVIALYGALSALLGGVFFPVDALPVPLPELARLVPLAHALGPFRDALLGTSGEGEALRAAASLAGAALLLLPAGVSLLGWAVRRGLREGTLVEP